MKNERELQAACLKWARSEGVWARKTETPAYRGFPDVMCLHDGDTLFIEFKHPNGKGRLHPLQVKDHERLKAVGYKVHVIDSMDGFQSLIRQWKIFGRHTR